MNGAPAKLSTLHIVVPDFAKRKFFTPRFCLALLVRYLQFNAMLAWVNCPIDQALQAIGLGPSFSQLPGPSVTNSDTDCFTEEAAFKDVGFCSCSRSS
jgi:hypothetical protein